MRNPAPTVPNDPRAARRRGRLHLVGVATTFALLAIATGRSIDDGPAHPSAHVTVFVAQARAALPRSAEQPVVARRRESFFEPVP